MSAGTGSVDVLVPVDEALSGRLWRLQACSAPSTRIGYAIDIRVARQQQAHDGFAEPTAAVVDGPHQRVVPKGLLPGRCGALLLGVRQDEDAIQVHDHMPTRVRRRFTGQPPDTFAHFGAGGVAARPGPAARADDSLTTTTGPPGSARNGVAPPSYQEALPSCAYRRKITRPGTPFDPHVSRPVEIRLLIP
jgi:hypothetical protein